MKLVTVECLGCGERRRVDTKGPRHLDTGECPRCGYVGWAKPAELSERVRRGLRDWPLDLRRLWPVS